MSLALGSVLRVWQAVNLSVPSFGNPSLYQIVLIGHDLDGAQSRGLVPLLMKRFFRKLIVEQSSLGQTRQVQHKIRAIRGMEGREPLLW